MKEISFQNDVLPLKNKLFRLALRITLNREEAEDVVQDTLIKVWNARDRWLELDSIEAYSLTIARNLSLDRIKKMENQNDSLEEQNTERLDENTSTPSERMIQKDKLDIVRNIIDELPEKQRSCLQLRDIEGKSYKEIADILCITEDQVKVNIFRARQTVKQRFNNSTDMDYKYINQLLDRYWKGETSLEEEEILRAFFSQDELPAELKPYQALFSYEMGEAKQEALGDDFDQKMMAMIEDEYTKKPNKAKVISLTERLKPLFKAAAVVAIILTLGNAAQVPFQSNDIDSVENVGYIKSGKGVSVAMGDSASVDSMQRTGIDQVSTPTTSPTLLK